MISVIIIRYKFCVDKNGIDTDRPELYIYAGKWNNMFSYIYLCSYDFEVIIIYKLKSFKLQNT